MTLSLKSSVIVLAGLLRKALTANDCQNRKGLIMNLQNGFSIDALDKFTRAYLECALWSSLDDETPLDRGHDIIDISEPCLTAMIADCTKFQAENMPMIICDLSQAGYDFWLTRNHHGAGFWDGDWPEHGDILTEKSHKYGECDLYVGDDGLIYC